MNIQRQTAAEASISFDRVWGAETNIYEAGRSQDIEGDYENIIAREILSWPDMLPGSWRKRKRQMDSGEALEPFSNML